MNRFLKDIALIAVGAFGMEKVIKFGLIYVLTNFDKETIARDKFAHLLSLCYQKNPEEMAKLFEEVISAQN